MSGDLSGFSLMELFRSEAESQVAILSEGLVVLEGAAASPETIEPLMRAAHSLKGAARIVGLDAVVRVAHALEDCFVAAQRSQIELGSRHFDRLLRAVDLLSQISSVADDAFPAWISEHGGEIDSAVADLERMLSGQEPTAAVSTAPAAPPASPVAQQPPPEPAPEAPTPSDIQTPIAAVAPAGPPPQSTDAPRNVADQGERVVRVTADSLTQLMGLAGESLVEARRLRPFIDSLLALRTSQIELADVVQSLARPGAGSTGRDLETLERARTTANRCRQLLSDKLEEFEDYARRMEDLSDRLYHEVISSRVRPLADGVRGFPRLVRDVARQLGKKVQLDIKGEKTGVDRDILEKLEAPLNHLIRNALDHGLETPAERAAAGKPAQGKITLDARHRAGRLQITLSDDGRGIDRDALREKIVRRGLVTAGMAQQLTEAELLEFLFLPGFSTKEEVTDLSGRGVGLDVVQSMVQAVGGSVRVSSRLGEGTRFTLQLPITMSVIRALMVRVSGEPYAFPLNRIDSIQLVPRERMQELEGKPYFLLDSQPVGLIAASQVLELPPTEEAAEELAIVVVSDRAHRFGVVVDRFLGECDLQVRPLDPRLGKVPDISSVSVLDDGWPILIIDVEDMVRSIDNLLSGRRVKRLETGTSAAAYRPVKRVLVVDDSITVRELERQLLEGHGYKVDTAVDGMDGWNTVRSGHYDLVVSDVDMPRMDGIELVRRIKLDPVLRSLPVVIVSYKDREEDRMRGLDAGANCYLTKSSFHDETFLERVVDLIGEANG